MPYRMKTKSKGNRLDCEKLSGKQLWLSILNVAVIIAFWTGGMLTVKAQPEPYDNPINPVERRVPDLIGRMPYGRMSQPAPHRSRYRRP